MKNTEKQTTLRIIEPADGMWLTHAVAPKEIYNTIFSKKVYLATNDKPENWKEISDAEKIAIEKQIEEAYKKEK